HHSRRRSRGRGPRRTPTVGTTTGRRRAGIRSMGGSSCEPQRTDEVSPAVRDDDVRMDTDRWDDDGWVQAVDRLEAALVDSSLEAAVDVVLTRRGPDTYRAAAVDGAVTFRRRADGGRWSYEVTSVE